MVKKYFFGTTLVTTWAPGSKIVFKGEWDGKPYEDKGIVKTYFTNRSLSYLYFSNWSGMEDKPENYLLISYEVTPIAGATELVITQTNYDEEKAKHSEANWAGVIDEMKKLLER